MNPKRQQPSRLPRLYFSLAHFCLAAAGAVLCLQPETYSGFFYHHQMMIPVHLVTLGWITSSILGALYMILPMAFRTRLSESKLDVWIFGFYAVGVSGMVSHFWLDSYGGMVWSAAWVVAAVIAIGIKVLRALKSAQVAVGVKIHLAFAFLNFFLAASLGALIGLSKAGVVLLPLHPMPAVYAHVHLAVLGWATMMVFGVSYRLLPMLLPSAVPSGRRLVAGAVLFETGVLSLFAALLTVQTPPVFGASVTTLGLLFFGSQVIWMLQNPRSAPKERPPFEVGRLLIFLALSYLLASLLCGWSLGMGLWPPELAMRFIPVYGTLALLGFLGQMILGVIARIWPLYAWQTGFASRTGTDLPPSPWKLMDRRFMTLILLLWTLGVPLLAWGFFQQQALPIGIAGFLIFVTSLTSYLNLIRIDRRSRL